MTASQYKLDALMFISTISDAAQVMESGEETSKPEIPNNKFAD